MTPEELERAERGASETWREQIGSSDEEQRYLALYVAVRAFQAALAIQHVEVVDWLALCELLDQALDEHTDRLDAGLPDRPLH